MTTTSKKILALIPSKLMHNNRRGAQRDTWLREARSYVKTMFVVQGGFVEAKEKDDTVAMTDTIYDGEHITASIVETIEFFKHVSGEWVLICDNLAYLWMNRLTDELEHPTMNFIGYEGKDGRFYFIRRSVFNQIVKEDRNIDIIQAIKNTGIPLVELKNITHPIQYPKNKNKIKAVLGQRPDKIIRIHDRRDTPHVAIVTICLGKYDRFFGGWYESIQEYFLPRCTRHYYVFADRDDLPYVDCEYCTIIPQENLGWPGNTRDRFDMCLKFRKEIEENYDYVYFVQVTGRLITRINENECVPDADHDYLWVTRNIDMPDGLTYDPNPRSAAYIPIQMGRIYAQGGAIGGRCKEFFQLCEACSLTLAHNKENGVGEYLNDESHLNHYILTKNPLEGWLRFWWPPTEEQAKKCKLFTLDKRRYGGFMALKGAR